MTDRGSATERYGKTPFSEAQPSPKVCSSLAGSGTWIQRSYAKLRGCEAGTRWTRNKVSNDSAIVCVCASVFAVRRCQKQRTQNWLRRVIFAESILNPSVTFGGNHVFCLA